MIELAFVACVKTIMHVCEERSIAYLPDVSLMACMMQAPPEFARWSEAHPDLQVTRWSCHHSDDRTIEA